MDSGPNPQQMKNLLFTLCILLIFPEVGSGQSLAEKLGYTKNDKLLIIHGDDLGVSHSQNKATFAAMQNGLANSASMMVPTAWSAEVGVLAKELSHADIGIHITLTNEWLSYNWGPEAGRTAVPGLADAKGHMHPSCEMVTKFASPEEVELEIRAQIKAANQLGIVPTHLDSHMGCVFFGRPEYLKSYLKIAQELKIPTMLNADIMEGLIRPNLEFFEGINLDNLPIVNSIIMATPEDYKNGMETFYTNALTNLKPGVHVILNHLAFDDAEMNAVTRGFDSYRAPWRQADYDFLQIKKLPKS